MNKPTSLGFEIRVSLLRETEKAWQFILPGLPESPSRTFWVPKSQAEYKNGVLELPEWLAKEKDLL